jgi:hypothetical protein
MDPVHAHLILNHIPSIGLGAVALLLAYGLFRKSDEVVRAALLGLIIIALTTIVVFLTGEPAEEAVEDLPGVLHDYIESHESAGLIALFTVEAIGAAALVGLLLSRRWREIPRMFTIIALVLSLAGAGVVAWTSNLGGQIRHTEIRDSAAGQPVEGEREGEEGESGRGRGRGRGGEYR